MQNDGSRRASIVIGVPTFRRPEWLRRCLDSLAELEVDRPFRVIVADNDGERTEGAAVVRRIAAAFPHPIDVVVVTERGLAAVRNRLITEALADPDVELIAMLDDDEWAEPGWLAELLRVQAAENADIVGGPVKRVFETAVPAYVGEANHRSLERFRTGPIDFIEATSNILFKTSIFRERPGEPWFDPKFGLIGGEDKDALTGFKMQGLRFAWAAQAIVTEELPASRCSASWMLKRAFRVGNSDMLINLKRSPPGFTLVSETGKIVGALGVALFNMTIFAWSPERRFEGARLGARVVGKLAALTGRRYEEYRVTHGR